LINSLVPRAELMNAIALNSSMANLAKIIGPSLGGVLISVIGVAGCLFVNALSFLAIIATLMIMEIPPVKIKTEQEAPFWREVVEGYRFLRGERRVFSIILLCYGVALVGTVRPAVWVTALLLAAFVFVNAGRTMAGSSFGLDAARERPVAAMGVRTAATHFGYLVGASVGGVALHVGGYPAVGLAFAALYVLAALPHVALVGLRRARVARAGA